MKTFSVAPAHGQPPTPGCTPHLGEHGSAVAGQTSCDLLRWVNTRAERGSWSATPSATVTRSKT